MDRIYTAQDVEVSLKEIRRCLERVRSRINGHVVSAEGLVNQTRMQVMFNLKQSGELDRALYEIIMAHALAAEKLGPGGFDRCTEQLLRRFDGALRSFTGSPRVASIHEVSRIVLEHTCQVDPRVALMLHRALELAGFGGRIIVEKTRSTVPSVELVRGYTFDLQQLLPIDTTLIRPRIFCIDGYVEQVSEVHHLLEAAAEAKEPCVLFVRGASDDVKHTLKVNYDRGSLCVLPVGVRFDLAGMNTLVDLAIVSGCDLVTHLKGDLISSIGFSTAPHADQVTFHRNNVVMTNAATYQRVGAHVAELRQRRIAELVDDRGQLLDGRIKSLSPNHVVIRLRDDRDFVVNSQAIDHALRAIKAAVDYGIVGDNDLMATELAASTYADRCFNVLRAVGGMISHSGT